MFEIFLFHIIEGDGATIQHLLRRHGQPFILFIYAEAIVIDNAAGARNRHALFKQ